ncbi:TPA: class 1b ribonucleoside-diphosphate reductase subunit beta, partial [Streptococcus suis]
RKLTAEEKDLVGKVFGGLTLLDTLQSETGVQALRNDIRTPHEEAVYNNIQFMESVHAKSYSSIFSTLNTKSEIEDIFEWTNSNEYLQRKAKIINEIYETGTPLEKKVASVFLETFLFYSGFFTPLYYLGNNKLANVAEIIKLIIRDESVHGTYIGYKFQLGFNELSGEEQDKLRDWMYDLLYQLYENEEGYTRSLYDAVGWTEEVLTFLRYNANKALMNLGQDPLFPDSADDVNPIIMNGISTGTSNHDFFSQVGNGYLLGEVEAMQDDDYLYGL